MSDQHTPEPWRVVRQNPSPTTGEWMISGAKPGYLAEVRDCGSGAVKANARRIVACVNALSAFTTDEIENGSFKMIRCGSCGGNPPVQGE